MTLALPSVIAKLIPRLGSPHDGEIVATARAIERVLKSEKRDWHDVAAAVTAQSFPAEWNYEPHRTESGNARQMRARLEIISRESWLNAWTAGFVADLLRRHSLDGLSVKQQTCVDRIIKQAFDRGVRADRRAA